MITGFAWRLRRCPLTRYEISKMARSSLRICLLSISSDILKSYGRYRFSFVICRGSPARYRRSAGSHPKTPPVSFLDLLESFELPVLAYINNSLLHCISASSLAGFLESHIMRNPQEQKIRGTMDPNSGDCRYSSTDRSIDLSGNPWVAGISRFE